VLEESRYALFVASRSKNPLEIRKEFADKNPIDVAILHGVMGVATEAGELLGALKKSFAYNQTVDYENIIEEIGDIEFYLTMIRNAMQLGRGEVLEANMKKLTERYPEGYSDQAAKERADKIGEGKED